MGGAIRGAISVVECGGEQEKARFLRWRIIEKIGVAIINRGCPKGCVLVWDERLEM